MSYEGTTQQLCVKGHQQNKDCRDETEKCDICGEKIIWSHEVDQTNDDGFWVKLEKAKEAVTEKCACCGHVKLVEDECYKIPTAEEVLKQSKEYNLAQEKRYGRV